MWCVTWAFALASYQLRQLLQFCVGEPTPPIARVEQALRTPPNDLGGTHASKQHDGYTTLGGDNGNARIVKRPISHTRTRR